MANMKAGAAAVVIRLGEDCFPNAECVAKHDDVHVRCVILESGEKRFALLNADMPSMFPGDMRYCKKLLQEKAGVDPAYSWVTVSHSFSAPHTWPVGDNEQKDTPLPPKLRNSPELRAAAQKINEQYRIAYDEAVQQALDTMRDASIGFGTGSCGININRNMWTKEGWWQGVNPDGYADHSLRVIRVNDTEGKPIAILYNYSCSAGACAGPILPDGGKLVSGDIPGYASETVEKEWEGCTAIFMPGATADQVSQYKINYTYTDKDGYLRQGGWGEAGYVLVAEQGRMLGCSVIEAARGIQSYDSTPEIRSAHVDYTVSCQKRETDMGRMKPSLSFSFIPDGEREMTIDGIVLGDIAMVGLLPEMDGENIASVRERSPYEKTIVSCFVNGNGKSMPQKAAYPLFQYSAMNSPFVEGSAEKSCDLAVEMLQNLKK